MLDMGIPGVCNKWLTLPPNPDIVDIDLLYDVAGAGGKRLEALTKKVTAHLTLLTLFIFQHKNRFWTYTISLKKLFLMCSFSTKKIVNEGPITDFLGKLL